MNSIGLRISERMSGWIKFPGRSTEVIPFEFTLCAYFPWLRVLGRGTVRGTARFPGHEDELPLEGDLILSPLGPRYRLSVDSSKWGRIAITGRKRYRWVTWSISRFKDSLVRLPFIVKGESKKSDGEGVLLYRLPLWKFVFDLGIVQERYAYQRSLKLAEKLALLSPLFVDQGNRFSNSEKITQKILEQIDGVPTYGRVLLKICLNTIKILCFLRFGRLVFRIKSGHADAMGAFLGRGWLRNLVTLPVSTIVLAAVFSDQDFLEEKKQNQVLPPEADEPERWRSLCHTPSKSIEDLEVDVVVVGSGAGGAAAAYELASQGYAVAIVEQGNYFHRSDLTGKRIEMSRKLYVDGSFTFALSDSPIWIPRGKGVGGTTLINSGTSFRTPNKILKKWESDLGISLDPYFQEVESVLDVKEVPQELHGPIEGIVATGVRGGLIGRGAECRPLSRGESGCDGQSFCIVGCPTGAKRSTDVSFIPMALSKNAHLFTHYHLDKVWVEEGKVVGIHASVPGYGKEFPLRIRSKKVILACGALDTPVHLHRLGVSGAGKGLTIHPALNVGALFPRRVRASRFVPQSLGVELSGDDHFLLEGYTLPVDSVALTTCLPARGTFEVMDQVERFTNFASMTRDPGYGKLLFWGNRAIPVYRIPKELVAILHRSTQALAEMFFNAGAEKVFTPVRGFEVIESEDLPRLAKTKLNGRSFCKLSAYHPLGTCQMGTDPKTAAISPTGEVFGFSGLYVADGSAIPGPLGVNPQVTIMANSLRIARDLGKQLSEGGAT